MSKSNKNRTRRQLIEQMQREQVRADRRRTRMIVAAGLIVALAIIAYPAIRLVQDSRARNTPLAELGVTAAQASCDKTIEDKTAGNLDHKPDGTPLSYAVSPPSSGPHYATPAAFGRKFYTPQDRPTLGNLVHNLEHGYTILWYSASIPQDKRDLAERIAKTFTSPGQAGKFIAAPYKDTDGGPPWPSGKSFALTHWGGGEATAQKGYREFCGDLSGAVVKDFTDRYPATDSPEPNAG